MTTREESLLLMDYLRHFDTLGECCREDAGSMFTHLPESCAHEVAEYLAWERMLRASDPIAEDAYFHIRRTAKRWWQECHGQPDAVDLAERVASGVWTFEQDIFELQLEELEHLHGVNLRLAADQDTKHERILGGIAIR